MELAEQPAKRITVGSEESCLDRGDQRTGAVLQFVRLPEEQSTTNLQLAA